MSSFGLVSILRRTVQCGANRTTLFRSKTSITPSMSSKQIARAQILNSHFSSICSNNYGYPKSHINDSVTNKTLLFKRFKGKRGLRKSKNQQEEDDEGEEDDDDDDDAGEENPLLMEDLPGANDGSQTVTIDVNSLRLDAVAKVAFSCTRARIEEAFYKRELLINGEKAAKKSEDLSLSDEVDLIMQNNVEDPTKIDIKRFQIVKLPDKASDMGRMKIDIKRWTLLTIEPYDNSKE